MCPQIAVVGLGSMGGAMATTLLRHGWPIVGFDPSPAARAAAMAAGVTVVDHLEMIRKVDHVVLSLPSAEVVRETVPRLLAVSGASGIIDTTTSDPRTSMAMADAAHAQGVAFIDAPVSGGRAGAQAGTLNAFVGGDVEDLAAVGEVLSCLTSGNHRHVGGHGAGNVVKLLNNILCAVNLVAVGEALAIAQAHGVDPATVARTVSEASGGSHVSSTIYPTWILSGTHDSGFTLGLMARDAALALDVAALAGEHPTLLASACRLWQEGLAALGPQVDFTEIATTVAPALSGQGDEER